MSEPEAIGPRMIEKLRHRYAGEIELLKATIAFEHAALKAPMLLERLPPDRTLMPLSSRLLLAALRG